MDYRPGHARFCRLLSALDLPRPRLRIRVAGTNGKGSTAHMLAAALQAAGWRVGLYSSPHLLHFNERIRLDGEPVADDGLLQALQRIVPQAEAAGTSPFETSAALALDLFARHGVEAEVIEAGVGARLDTCTAIPADMALITPIGPDHQAWLGETLAAIAEEKAWAMHGCRWALTGAATQAPEALAVLQQHHPALQLVPRNKQLKCRMPGAHQQDNASLALAAMHTLQQAGLLTATHARQTICATQVAGRLQHIRRGQAHIWLDAAHNAPGLEAVAQWCRQRAVILDGILLVTREDRQLATAAAYLKPWGHTFRHLHPPLHAHRETTRQALTCMVNHNPRGEYLVLGSFQTIAAVLELS